RAPSKHSPSATSPHRSAKCRGGSDGTPPDEGHRVPLRLRRPLPDRRHQGGPPHPAPHPTRGCRTDRRSRPHPATGPHDRRRAAAGRRHQRERNHTMTEFTKGDRVIGTDTRSDALVYGTVDDVSDDACVYGTRDSGGRFVARPWHLTKVDDEPKPLRFEDVRDGDTITVEVEDRFTLTGTAIVNPNKSV